MTVTSLAVVGASGEYPIGPKDHGVDFLMDHRHLWLRSSRPHATLRIRHEFLQGIRDFLYENGFINVDTPVLTPAACEGTTTLFETDYFDTKAYLTQSGQLYNEATAMAFGKVYCFGPTFRAEKAKTRRHLIEFWMVEPEMAYATLDDAMDVAEALVVYLVERVRTRRARELEVLERDPKALEAVKPPFPRISYGEAVERLHAAGHDFGWGNDFGAADETVLSRGFDRPFFVHRFPAAVKAFYMKRDPGDERLALGADLLAPEGYGEIVGGGQREDDLETLERRIAEHGLPRSAFEWYLDLRRYGSVPHSGFGLGIERTLAWICGVDHVRETIPFPRLLNRMTP
jgi:asparaginyl-tRNA synthetase